MMSGETSETFRAFPGYEVTRRLGSGTTGDVYLAVQVSTGRQVAIKALAPGLIDSSGFLSRFRQEARLMTRFDDANLVSIYDYVEHDGAYLVMQYVPGVQLRSLTTDGHRLTPEQALGVLTGVLSGLAAAHRLGVVHGDLKPENVIVSAEGVSKLVDFGQASPSGSRPSGGTPAYASPEAVRNEVVDPRSDIYAAGLILYELLAGKPPFVGTAAEVAAAHLDRLPERVQGVPPPVADLVARSLSKSPVDRPASAEEFLASLQEAATASYGPHWRQRASVAALAGALVGGGAAAATVASASPALPTGASAASNGRTSAIRHLHRARRLATRFHQAVSAHPVSSVAATLVVAGAATAVVVIGGPAVAGPFSTIVASGRPGQVVCADASHCWVTLGSSVLAIGPSGQRTDAQLPAELQSVTAVACASDSYCLAVGSGSSGGGAAATSMDGGVTWQAASLPPAVAGFTSASCAQGTTVCWAASRSGLYRSAGPGQWALVTTPDASGPIGLLSCPTATTCVGFAGGSAETTHDAGASWTTVGLPGVLYSPASLDCVDGETCWVVGERTNSLQSQIGTIDRTTDGGTTWSAVPFPASPQPYAFDSVSCWSATDCLVDGTVEWGGLESSSGSPYFISTTDAGGSWRVQPAPETMPFVPAIDCLDATDCWLSGPSGIGSTADDGATWNVDWYGSRFDVSALSCPAVGDCYAGGAFPNLTRGHLGAFVVTGSNPMAVVVGLEPGGGYSGIDASDPLLSQLSGLSCSNSVCVGIGPASSDNQPKVVSIAITSGRVATLAAPGRVQSLSGVACPSADGCLVTGDAGGQPVLFRQRGATWSALALPYGTQGVGAISCPSAARCFLLADDGAPELLSADIAGSSQPVWGRVSLPSATQSLTALACPSAGDCWVGAVLQPAGSSVATAVILRTLSLQVSSELSISSTTQASTTTTSTAPSAAGWTTEQIPAGVTEVTALDCPSAAECLAEATLTNGDDVLIGAGQTGPVAAGQVAPPSTA